MELDILYSVKECFCYLLNKVRLFHPLHLDWLHVFSILALLFNDYHTHPNGFQSQVGGLSHTTYEEDDSFIQSICKAIQNDLYLMSPN